MNKKIIALFLIGIFLVAAVAIEADVPSFVSYQERLTDVSGEALNGQYNLTFSIYDQAESGLLKWSESHPLVTVENGVFGVILGTYVPLVDSVFSGPERFLEVSIDGEPMSKRTQFTSVTYTYRTASIDGADGGVIKGSIILTSPNSNDPNLPSTNLLGDPVIDISVDSRDLGKITFYEPADTKSGDNLALFPSVQYDSRGMIIYDENGTDTSAVIYKDETGNSVMTFYEPVDTKANPFASTSKKFVIDKNGLVMYGNTIDDTAISLSQDETGSGVIAFYEPVDTKSGNAVSSKRIEMNRLGLYMFGQTVFDTSLIVAPSGDIIGIGQITMGENSNSGFETSVLGFNNSANGDSSTIGGGSSNITNGSNTVIAGGFENTADGNFSIISGGSNNTAGGFFATIIGGFNNTADGPYSSILGGSDNYTLGSHSLSAGFRASASHDGSFVWADFFDEPFSSTDANQFLIRASGGVGIGTNAPAGLLDVVGTPGDSSVNLPDDAISSPEIFDEPGLSSSRQTTALFLAQSTGVMLDVVTTTITIPAAGYIMLSGGGTFTASGTNKANQAIVQIDETSGGGMVAPYHVKVGSGDHDSPSKEHFFSLNVERIYYKPAGTYTFILEGMANPANNPIATSTLSNSFLTAIFMPTSYGSVEE